MINEIDQSVDLGVIATFVSSCETDTVGLGATLGTYLRQGDILTLEGTLGMGKTALARGLIRHLCGYETVVPSPTFTLVQIYDAPDFPIWHCDLFRIKSSDDALEIGFDEAFTDAATLIEWPERLASMLPERRLRIRFLSETSDGNRMVTLEGGADWKQRIEGLSIDGRP